MPRPKLYSGTKNASSWALRAWLALRAAGVEFDEEVVDIRRPQRFANLAAIGRFAPPASVPVLVVDERSIFDSVAIMEYANDISGGQLLPADLLLRAEARSILAWQHSGLSEITPRLSFESAFYADRRALAESEIEQCGRLMAYLQQLLRHSGGPFLFGACSLADLALVPTALKLDRHHFPWCNWSPSETWAATLLSMPAVVEWLAEADALPPIWYDIYLPKPERKPSAETAWVVRPKSSSRR
jgi:glutathione S-transferase